MTKDGPKELNAEPLIIDDSELNRVLEFYEKLGKDNGEEPLDSENDSKE